jgi:predicted nucleic acid-binding protein
VASPQQVQLLLPTLDYGEAEVITLALEQNARLVLIDELTGRRVAQSLGLTITGSVGVLIQAKQLGEIKTIKPFLNAMTQQGIHFSQRFIAQVLQKVGE